jgi:hypothetical protein
MLALSAVLARRVDVMHSFSRASVLSASGHERVNSGRDMADYQLSCIACQYTTASLDASSENAKIKTGVSASQASWGRRALSRCFSAFLAVSEKQS